MDRKERINDEQEALRIVISGFLSVLWTSLPGIIQSFDPVAMTCTVQPSIKGQIRLQSGEAQSVALPLLVDCPVQFPAGGNCTLTFPVAKGDECLVVFASRCIDSWWQSGGVQEQAELRMHDLSDGFVLLGFRSKPRTLANVSTSAAQLRSDDGTTIAELNPSAKTITLSAPGGVTINANTQINGNLSVSGTITAAVDVIGAGKSLKSHVHGGVSPGSSNTGTPV